MAELPELHVAVFRFSQPVGDRTAHVYHAYYGRRRNLAALKFTNTVPVGKPAWVSPKKAAGIAFPKDVAKLMHVNFTIEPDGKTALSEDYPPSVKSAVDKNTNLADIALGLILDNLKQEGITRFRRVREPPSTD